MIAFIAGMFFMGAKMNDRCYECMRGQQIDKD